MLFISDYIYWIVVGSCHAWSSTSIWGGRTEWLFGGGKKIINFVCSYIWFQWIIIIDSYVVSAWFREEPKQKDERAYEEDPIIPIISLHMTTEDL